MMLLPRRKKKALNLRKRGMLLLEVVIAIFLLTVAAFPLIAPHVFMFKEQKHFAEAADLDHAANLIYADIYQSLHRNEIATPWDNETVFEVDQRMLDRIDTVLPKGTKAFFSFEKKHGKERADFAVYQVACKILFKKEKMEAPSIEYCYIAFVARNQPSEELNEESDEKT